MPKNETQVEGKKRSNGSSLIVLTLLLGAALAVLCHQAFLPHQVMWANDTQFGLLKASYAQLPSTYLGVWQDVWWIGQEVPAPSPSFTIIFATFVSPEMFLRIYTPLTMLFLGFSAWLLFRQLKFAPMVCVVGGLAAGLNMHCFSNACWGLGSWNVCIASIFLALAALVTDSIRQPWIKAILAGLAVGMAVMEGFDSGAILSVFVGIFVVFFCWITESAPVRRISKSILTGGLVVVFAVLIAASTLATLVGTQIQGITSAAQTPEQKKATWDFATQWSLPKMETLRVIIPGIFGYRMEEFMTTQDKSSAYWGKVGEDVHITPLESNDPEVRAAAMKSLGAAPEYVEIMRGNDVDKREQLLDAIRSNLQRRHSGNGEYAGVLVALFAIFGLVNSFRRADSPYSRNERFMVWFFGLAALFSLVAAYGRHAFLYAILYELPYFSAIRNPIKFMHPFTLTWVILSAYGLEAFYRCCLRSTGQEPLVKSGKSKTWWEKLPSFNRKCVIGFPIVVAAAFVAYHLFFPSDQDLSTYLQHHGFAPDLAESVAVFSAKEVVSFIIYLTLSVAVITTSMAGAWAGTRAWVAWAFLCAIMIFDLSRADAPWVRYFDYEQKYSMNDITKLLKDKPFEHRVNGRLSPRGNYYPLTHDNNFGAVIHWWLENDFPYNDIQSLEIDQMPRTPYLDANFLGVLTPRADTDFRTAARMWQLSNTRYIFAAADLLPAMNQQFDPAHPPFKFAEIDHHPARFNFVPKPGVTLIEDAGDLFPKLSDKGNEALLEYTDALPRAKLYSTWITNMTDEQMMQVLPSPQWDPAQIVLVSSNTPVPPPSNPGADAGTVRISDYAPKDIKLQASAKTPAVLLYNDRTASAWRVLVDSKPAQLLRCNYIMRGVFLTPGDHTIEFQFQPPLGPLYITLVALAVGILLGGYLIWCRFSGKSPRVAT